MVPHGPDTGSVAWANVFCDPNTSVLGPRGQGRAEMAVTLEKMGKYTTHGSYQMLKVVLLPLQASRPI